MPTSCLLKDFFFFLSVTVILTIVYCVTRFMQLLANMILLPKKDWALWKDDTLHIHQSQSLLQRKNFTVSNFNRAVSLRHAVLWFLNWKDTRHSKLKCNLQCFSRINEHFKGSKIVFLPFPGKLYGVKYMSSTFFKDLIFISFLFC